MPQLDANFAISLAASVAVIYAALLTAVFRAVRSDDETLSLPTGSTA